MMGAFVSLLKFDGRFWIRYAFPCLIATIPGEQFDRVADERTCTIHSLA